MEFKYGGGASSPFIKEHCYLSLEILEQSHEFANLHEIDWQRASAELASCTAYAEGSQTGLSKSTTACNKSLCVVCETIGGF